MSRLGERQMKMTPERKQEFLLALRDCAGVYSHACRLVSEKTAAPGASPPAYSTWKKLIAEDDEFASAVAEVMQLVRDDIHREIHRRAMEGVQEAVIQKGEQAKLADGEPAFITRYDNRLLLRLASKLDPSWTEGRTVEITTTESRDAMTLTLMELRQLSPGERDTLSAALAIVRRARDYAEPKAITHEPGEIVDATFEEVKEEDEAPLSAEEAEKAFPY